MPQNATGFAPRGIDITPSVDAAGACNEPASEIASGGTSRNVCPPVSSSSRSADRASGTSPRLDGGASCRPDRYRGARRLAGRGRTAGRYALAGRVPRARRAGRIAGEGRPRRPRRGTARHPCGCRCIVDVLSPPQCRPSLAPRVTKVGIKTHGVDTFRVADVGFCHAAWSCPAVVAFQP